MIESQNVIFIEWYKAAILVGGKHHVRWLAKIPSYAYTLLTGTGTGIVIHLEEEVIDSLYPSFGDDFAEFPKIIKSLAIEQLCNRTHKTLFIFGTHKIITMAYESIICDEIYPGYSFTGSLHKLKSLTEGDKFIVTVPDEGPILLTKLNSGITQNAIPSPRLE
jgi:hypothetical protein